MNLSELYPSFLKRTDTGFESEVQFAEADGVIFHCPECTRKAGKPEGTHMIICWDKTVPLDVNPGPGRWIMVGTGVDDLSLVNGSSSVLLENGCRAHFWIRCGKIVFC